MKRFFYDDTGKRRWLEKPYAQGHVEIFMPEIRTGALRGKLVLAPTDTEVQECGDQDKVVTV